MKGRIQKAAGFTLMEIIGVLAVIAIIASVATPQIFQAIEDAKVSAVLQKANELKLATARFYKDTGRLPIHYPTYSPDTHPYYKQLMMNSINGNKDPIPGWNGPYLEAELVNPVTANAHTHVSYSSSITHSCDLLGDGETDGNFVHFRIDGVSDSIAKKVSEAMDKDGSKPDDAWKTMGRVKRYNGDHPSILNICLHRIP